MAHYVSLTASEEAFLHSLEQEERSFRRGGTIRREHDNARELFIVQKGWLHSGAYLGNGTRQIMRFHFPGDVVGLSSLAFGQSTDSITAVTDVTLCPFDKDQLGLLFAAHPRLAALIFNLSVAERVSLADRLASIGRTSARARVALLLCEIFARLKITNGRAGAEFHLPLTQEDIGDATGLTSVHVNRMMRSLVEDGLIARTGSLVRVLDEGRLKAEANFTDRFARVDVGWLPGAA